MTLKTSIMLASLRTARDQAQVIGSFAAASCAHAGPSSWSRSLSTSSPSQAKRRQKPDNDPLSIRKLETFNYDDIPTAGHRNLLRIKRFLDYYRVAEHEMPKLRQFRREYNPPAVSSFLRLRLQHYQGEAHPAANKAVLSVPVAPLFSSGVLGGTDARGRAARRRFLLLAGPRWDRTAGAARDKKSVAVRFNAGEDDLDLAKAGGARVRQLGEVTISCELMPTQQQNIKWCSDRLDDLIAEANKPTDEAYSLLPVDERPRLVRDAKRTPFNRSQKLTLSAFPKEWL